MQNKREKIGKPGHENVIQKEGEKKKKLGDKGGLKHRKAKGGGDLYA